MSLTTSPQTKGGRGGRARKTGRRRRTSLLAHGEPMVWLTGGSLVVAMVMIAGLLGLVFLFGTTTFWPSPLVNHRLHDGTEHLGEITRTEAYRPDAVVLSGLSEELRLAAEAELASGGGVAGRRLVRTGNRDLTGVPFRWLSDFEIAETERPEWALTVERLAWGRFYGTPVRFLVDGEVVAEGPGESWAAFREQHGPSLARFGEVRQLEEHDVGRLNRRLESARLALRQAELDEGRESPAWRAANERFSEVQAEVEIAFQDIRRQTDGLKAENDRFRLVLATSSGAEKELVPQEIVRAYPANQLGFWDKLAVYFSRWWEFLTEDPRDSNSEGGVLPAIVGTVAMTLVMSIVVVPFGVLAALYLREYAKQGAIISTVRIAVNNLAGVPSIVFGVFGLGFFCYIIGASIDELLFEAALPNPTYGKGGMLWASLTLALLTLPVVIVATEEALAAVPTPCARAPTPAARPSGRPSCGSSCRGPRPGS